MYQTVIFGKTQSPKKVQLKHKQGSSIHINLSSKQDATFINEENVYQRKYFTVTQI